MKPLFPQRTAASERTLTINDTLASEKLTRIGDTVVVPIADVAKALGLRVVKTKTGYALTKDGGANQVEGLRGKLGQELFDGKWRFKVTDMREATSYTLQTRTATDYGTINPVAEILGTTYKPKPGYKLIIFRCVVKNGQRTAQQLWWFQVDVQTAIATESGESFPPILTDIAAEAWQSKPILPGAKLEYNLVFCIPTDQRSTDLLVTLRTISEKGSTLRLFITDPALRLNKGGAKRL